MIESLLRNPLFRRVAPVALGLFFIVLFISLGFWQLDRAAQKKALLASFGSDGAYSRTVNFDALDIFERLEVVGQYEGERQILIDNIPVEGRVGYYVITPFRVSANGELLLVNRGWIARSAPNGPLPEIALPGNSRTLRGLAGRLPRVGIRPGEAFEGARTWPRVAVYPDADEVAAELGEPVLPSVLLLGPDEDDGFLRRWEPKVSGPATNYGYAFQWFAMASAIVVLLVWHSRKTLRRSPDDGKTG